MSKKELAPDGMHKGIIKNILHDEYLTTFYWEIIGGKKDGYVYHFNLDRINKSKMFFETLQIICLCGGVKNLSFPYYELIGIKINITVKNKKIKKISCFKDKNIIKN